MMHRGHVQAQALWFPPGTPDVAARALKNWQSGARLLGGDWGHLLTFPTPRRFDCAIAPGVVIPKDTAKLDLLWHGQPINLSMTLLEPADPTPWLAKPLEVIEGEPLARPVESPDERATWPKLELRKELPGIPPRAPQVTLQMAPPRAPWWRRLLDRLTPSNQPNYVDKMRQMFERSDWDQALRHAIPLGETGLLQRFGGSLKPRQDLHIGARRQATHGVELSGTDYLRTLYRRAFDQLDRAGQVDQAAFVLAELLNEHQQAVLYLEKHGRFRVAARLAEARNLDISLRIRLWFQAGEPDLAVQLASHHNAYQQAYLGLSGVDKQRAEAWRWEWARFLAWTGRPAQALELVWSTGLEARREWLQPAVDQGGLPGGRSLARWLTDPGDEAERLLALGRSWLAELEPHTQSRVVGLALGLIEGAPTPEARLLAAETARVLMSEERLEASQLESLVRVSQDPWLRADLPRRPAAPVRLRREAWVEVLEEAGNLTILDLATLPDGRLLAALGEAGVAIVSARGRIAGVLPVPAHQIVAPWNGDLHILVARRGTDSTLTRLDPATLKTRPWCTVSGLEWLADSHDGGAWLVVRDNTLFLIDLGSEGWRALSQQHLAYRPVGAVLRPSGLALLSEAHAEFRTWPGLELRRRILLPTTWGLGPEELVDLHVTPESVTLHGQTWRGSLEGAHMLSHGGWDVVVIRQREGTTLFVVHRARSLGTATFFMPGTRAPVVRSQPGLLVLGDELGRCYCADLEQGWFTRALGLSLSGS